VLDSTAAHAGERDMGAWAAEWIAVPEAVILTAGLTAKLAHVLEGLEVDVERMAANLAATDGAIMAEAVMMALARTVGHEPAHEAVTAASRRAAATGTGLREALLEDGELRAVLTPAALDDLLDPSHYLGLAVDTASAVGAATPTSEVT
jgi:3-carboxy-cis,cis-muconate cycloisomerase